MSQAASAKNFTKVADSGAPSHAEGRRALIQIALTRLPRLP